MLVIIISGIPEPKQEDVSLIVDHFFRILDLLDATLKLCRRVLVCYFEWDPVNRESEIKENSNGIRTDIACGHSFSCRPVLVLVSYQSLSNSRKQENKRRLTVYSRFILWVQPPVKELPTFPFLGFYSWDVTHRNNGWRMLRLSRSLALVNMHVSSISFSSRSTCGTSV